MTSRRKTKPAADGRSMPALDGGRSVVDMMRDWMLSLPLTDKRSGEEIPVHIGLEKERLTVAVGQYMVTIEVENGRLKAKEEK